MKRNALFCGIIFIAVVVLGGTLVFGQNDSPENQRDYSSMQTIGSSSSLLFYPLHLDELEEKAELIVQGHLRNDAHEHLNMLGGGGDATFVVHGCTISSLEITKVYKGDIQLGDTILLTEPFYVHHDNGVDSLVYLANYFPSTPEQEYLFFLGVSKDRHGTPNEVYCSRGLERGRFPVVDPAQRTSLDLNNISEHQLGLVMEREVDTYKTIYQEAIDKYMSD